jgi:hypothetical protein
MIVSFDRTYMPDLLPNQIWRGRWSLFGKGEDARHNRMVMKSLGGHEAGMAWGEKEYLGK